MAIRSTHRDALRILNILVAGRTLLPKSDASGAVAIFKGEARMYAFDFWMRYPDYLAEELINLFEETRNAEHLTCARGIFADDEPDIRRFPMIRYRFGAYERPDDTLAILVSRNLVKITGTKQGNRVTETDFLLYQTSIDLVDAIANEFPELRWYQQRAALIAKLAGSRGGAALKARQYQQFEYAETHSGGIIPSIKFRVHQRLQKLDSTLVASTATL